MRRQLRVVIEIVQQNGKGLTFRVSKVDKRRWNWELSVRYMETDPTNGQLYPTKTVIRTSNNQDELEEFRASLQRQYGDT